MDFGSTLKQIRLNKGMTLKEAAGETLSTAQLSRFENGKSEILAKDFHEILHNLNTSYEEFLLFLNDDRQKDQFRDLIKIAVLITNKRYEEAKQVGEQIKKKSYGPYSWEQFSLYFLENILLEAEGKPYQAEPVLHYLMEVDDWGEFELQIYCLFSLMFDTETNYFLMRTALKKSQKYFTLENSDYYLFTILNNNFGAFLRDEKLEYAEKCLHIYRDKYVREVPYTFAYCVMKFNEGVLQFKKGKIKSGKVLSEKALSLMKEFELFDQVNLYKKRLDNWMERHADPTFKEMWITAEFIFKYESNKDKWWENL